MCMYSRGGGQQYPRRILGEARYRAGGGTDRIGVRCVGDELSSGPKIQVAQNSTEIKLVIFSFSLIGFLDRSKNCYKLRGSHQGCY